jgi:predicted RNA binding protein YcfA (HicA-like mRNA interferase family)
MGGGSLRPVKWQVFHKYLLKVGCIFERKSGSHRVYKRPELLRPIIVPEHTFDIPVFVIQNNLRTLGIPKEHFIEYLKNKKHAKQK